MVGVKGKSGVYEHKPHSKKTKRKIGKTNKILCKIGMLKIWNKGLTKKTDKRIKIAGEKESKTKKKLFKEGKLKSNSEPLKKLHKEGRYKHIYTIERNKKIGKANKGNPKISIASKKRWGNKKWREKQIKAILKGLQKRPTSYEKKIADLCIENNLPFIYTGDGAFLINFKNPDFVNFGEKVVIEVFYSYYKIRDYGSVENYKEFCKQKYNPKGWRVIFIDENEVDVKNWKELCLNKIQKGLK